jgi:hypothetical protein
MFAPPVSFRLQPFGTRLTKESLWQYCLAVAILLARLLRNCL